MMRSIQIDSGGPPLSFDTLEKAVSAAMEHPLQSRALSCSELLQNSRVTGGHWKTGKCVVTFSNGFLLHIEARHFKLNWDVIEITTLQKTSPYEPVEFVWRPKVRAVFDPCSLLRAIMNARFSRLFINDIGLLLYTLGNPILWFHAVRDQESNQDLLFAALGD